MPCENCAVQFTVFKRKRACCECDRYFCSSCLGRGVGLCGGCRVLSKRPLVRHALDDLRIRDLQWFLQRQNISTRGCVEKDDLVNLVVQHVNSENFIHRPPPRISQNEFASTIASLRGFTSNINSMLSSAFDIGSNNGSRSQARARPANQGYSYTSHASATSSGQGQNTRTNQPPPQTSSPPGGASPTAPTATSPAPRPETNASFSPPQCIVTDTSTEGNSSAPARATRESDSLSEAESPIEPINTTDCIEVEDIDDSAEWEIIRNSLPEDSSTLLLEDPNPLSSPIRASSDLDLPSRTSDNSSGDTSSLKDSNILKPNSPTTRIKLDDLKDLSQVEGLNVKQLKELLVLNRVDFKGCCERKELLERAQRLWKENTKSREDIEQASTDALCKICMDAPIECVMLECGHIATCIACGKRLNECPICRQYVIRVVRFFRS